MILHPGEFYASGADLIISTVLGSCIAVVFYDPVRRIGAMNHFMLPGTQREDGYFNTEGGKYGMYAMELAINEMLKLGARREQLRCKVFGGAHVLRGGSSNEASVPQNNINFAFNYLETEKITVYTLSLHDALPICRRNGRAKSAALSTNLQGASQTHYRNACNRRRARRKGLPTTHQNGNKEASRTYLVLAAVFSAVF